MYVMHYGIYSLGVCLLEIELGESCVRYDEPKGFCRPSQLLAVSSEKPEVERFSSPTRIYIHIYITSFPSSLGRPFLSNLIPLSVALSLGCISPVLAKCHAR